MEYKINNSCVWITVNRKCNLRCFWCYAKEVTKSQENMSRDLLFNILDLCAEGGVKKIVFIGGEPTIYPYLLEAISYCKSLSIKTEITTNGLRLKDKSYVLSLVEAGIDNIMISIKGSTREDFLSTTGSDEFESIILALKHLSVTNIKYGVSAVLTTSFLENIELLLPTFIKYNVKILVFSFLFGFGDELSSIDFLEKNNPNRVLELLSKKIVSNQECFSRINWLIEKCSHIVNIEPELYKIFEQHFYASCKKFNQPISFDCSGNLIPCNNYPSYTIGKFGVDFNSYKELQSYVHKKL